MHEPAITINGTELTVAQAMTVRAAVIDFSVKMSERCALGGDQIGESIRLGYQARAGEVINLIHILSATPDGERPLDGESYTHYKIRRRQAENSPPSPRAADSDAATIYRAFVPSHHEMGVAMKNISLSERACKEACARDWPRGWEDAEKDGWSIVPVTISVGHDAASTHRGNMLTKPARVGNTVFREGISVETVIDAAQRRYEQMMGEQPRSLMESRGSAHAGNDPAPSAEAMAGTDAGETAASSSPFWAKGRIVDDRTWIELRMERINELLNEMRGEGYCSTHMRPLEDEFTFLRGRMSMLNTPPPSSHVAAWKDMSNAPKDGTILRLLVNPDRDEFTAFDDSLTPFETIGFNNLENTEEDRWEFAGWDWSQDCFITGRGEVIGWMQFGSNPAPVSNLEPLFWYRPVGEDGGYEGPHHSFSIEFAAIPADKRDQWKPLYPVAPAPALHATTAKIWNVAADDENGHSQIMSVEWMTRQAAEKVVAHFSANYIGKPYPNGKGHYSIANVRLIREDGQ